MRARKIEFDPPPGVVPEGTTSGEEFDAVTTYRVKDNGQICVVMVGDVKMPGYDSDESSHKPEYSPPDQMMGGY